MKGEYTGWAGHLERLTTQIAGGTAPDVMQVNWNWLVLFSRDGRGFYDLESLGDTIDLAQFDAEARAIGTVRGRLNALPVTMTARVFYFNATTFAKAGLAVPTHVGRAVRGRPDLSRAPRRRTTTRSRSISSTWWRCAEAGSCSERARRS